MTSAADLSGRQTNFWLLKLVPAGRWGRWVTGGLIFLAVILPYLLLLAWANEAVASEVDLEVALFFAVLFGYMVPVHHLIIQRSLAALEQLRPQLAEHPELIDRVGQRMLRKSPLWQTTTLVVGLVAGTVHNSLILSETGMAGSFDTILNLTVTTAIWITMTATISSLVENAVLFRKLSRVVTFDVLNTRSLTPFGNVAVSSTLALIGAQAAFPLLIIGAETSWVSFAPGLVATGAPMVFIFLLPIVPMHRRITSAKQESLNRIDAELSPLLGSGRPDYAALEPLLTYRREVIDAPEWPFDTSVIGRLAVYLIIPPLTWIGAALIEILVDTAI